MKAILNKGADGHTTVDIHANYGRVDSMTPLEAEEFMKELREAINQCRNANRKPRKIGDY